MLIRREKSPTGCGARKTQRLDRPIILAMRASAVSTVSTFDCVEKASIVINATLARARRNARAVPAKRAHHQMPASAVSGLRPDGPRRARNLETLDKDQTQSVRRHLHSFLLTLGSAIGRASVPTEKLR